MDPLDLPVWHDDVPELDRLGCGAAPIRADVAVIGGGYTGLSAARVLARAGARVALLDAGPIAGGASSRNGGMALIGLKSDASAAARKVGFERAERAWRASAEAVEALRVVCAEEAIACDFEVRGSLYLAAKPTHLREMRRESEWLERHFDYRRIDLSRDALAGEIGSAFFHGGCIDPGSASLHPAKLARGLAEAAARAGATLVSRTPVRAVERDGAVHRLRLATGTLRAKEVLVATNGYTGSALPGLARRVLPIGSYALATEPLPPALRRALSPKDRMFYDSRWLLAFFRLTPDGRLLFGGRTTLSPGRDPRGVVSTLRREMTAIFPALAETRISHCWSGRTGFSFDGLPHLGRLRDAHYALGYGGHGVALSCRLGAEAAEWILGTRTESPFLAAHHPTSVFYRRRPWIRPLLGAWLRARDWLA